MTAYGGYYCGKNPKIIYTPTTNTILREISEDIKISGENMGTKYIKIHATSKYDDIRIKYNKKRKTHEIKAYHNGKCKLTMTAGKKLYNFIQEIYPRPTITDDGEEIYILYPSEYWTISEDTRYKTHSIATKYNYTARLTGKKNIEKLLTLYHIEEDTGREISEKIRK